MTDSLVLYARVDGGYSIWDPVRSPITTAGLDLSTGYHFTQDELWQGLRAPEPDDRPELEWMCKGLIEDWIDWQARDPDWFDLFREVIRRLSPDGERIDVGEPVRLSPHDAQDVPTLVLPYGEVPIVHASAGMKRILGLAYGMVWAWREHRIIARQFGQTPARGLVILIDELEAHLHPRWQRVILGALFQVVDQIGQADPASGAIDVQIVTSTHAPLVSASAEPLFDPSRDKLFKFALEGREVVVHEEP